MAIFSSPADLLKRVATSVNALAQVITPDDHVVIDGKLLRLVIEAGDTAAYPADEIAAAQKGVENIEAALEAADDVILGDLRGRYPNAATGLTSENRLTILACDLALCDLFFLRTDDDVIRRCKQARADLADMRKGFILLDDSGAADLTNKTSEPLYHAPKTVFDTDNLKDY